MGKFVLPGVVGDGSFDCPIRLRAYGASLRVAQDDKQKNGGSLRMTEEGRADDGEKKAIYVL